jgi:hypothetical protein
MRAAAGFVVAALAVTACGGGGSARVQTRASTTTTTTVPASAPTSGGGPSVTIGIICLNPADASQTLVRAWIAGDAVAAARCATAAAVTALFARSGAGAAWALQGCDGPDPGVPQCRFSYPGGQATFTLMGSDASGWRVTQVVLAP